MKLKQCVLIPTLNHLKSLRVQQLAEQLSGAHNAAPGLLCSEACPNSEKANLSSLYLFTDTGQTQASFPWHLGVFILPLKACSFLVPHCG